MGTQSTRRARHHRPTTTQHVLQIRQRPTTHDTRTPARTRDSFQEDPNERTDQEVRPQETGRMTRCPSTTSPVREALKALAWTIRSAIRTSLSIPGRRFRETCRRHDGAPSRAERARLRELNMSRRSARPARGQSRICLSKRPDAIPHRPNSLGPAKVLYRPRSLDVDVADPTGERK